MYRAMASGLVRGCLSSILTDSTFSGCSQRGKDALEQVKCLLSKISEENSIDCYDEFSQKLMDALERIYAGASRTCTGKITLREQLWRQFHAIRLSELCEIWTTFLTTLKSNLDPLVQQYINQELFSDIIKSRCGSYPTVSTKATSMTREEENIVRYASGYVPYSLMKKYEKNVTEKSASFVECLSSMAITGEEGSFLEYTTEWVSKVNRGGLFEVNDTTFALFREIELCIRDKLTSILATSSMQPDQKDKLIKTVHEDIDVQFYWSLLSTDLETSNLAEELLRDIIELWLNIRGFSVAGQWMEVYKHNKSTTTKRAKSLRKTLKRKGESNTSKKTKQTSLKKALEESINDS